MKELVALDQVNPRVLACVQVRVEISSGFSNVPIVQAVRNSVSAKADQNITFFAAFVIKRMVPGINATSNQGVCFCVQAACVNCFGERLGVTPALFAVFIQKLAEHLHVGAGLDLAAAFPGGDGTSVREPCESAQDKDKSKAPAGALLHATKAPNGLRPSGERMCVRCSRVFGCTPVFGYPCLMVSHPEASWPLCVRKPESVALTYGSGVLVVRGAKDRGSDMGGLDVALEELHQFISLRRQC
jgi:hypothetical protein